MMNRYFFLISALFFSLTLNSQPSQDSNYTIIKNANKLEKIKILLEFSSYDHEKAPKNAIKYGMQALELSEEAGIPKYQADAMFSVGYGHYHLNNYDEALSYFLKSLNIREKIDDKEGIAACLNRIGNTHQLKGNFEKALNSYNHALTINKGLGDREELARTYTNLGSIYQLYGNYERAIDFYFKSLKIQEEKNNTEGMAWAYLNIARLFKKIPEYDKSLEYVNKSLSLYKEIEKFEGVSTGITLCLKEKGIIYYNMGDYTKALKYSKKVLKINSQTSNQFGIANSYSNIGKIYFEMGDYPKSLSYLQQAIEMKKSLGDNLELPSIYRFMGEIYLKQNNIISALNYFNKSLKVAKKQNLKDEIKETYFSLSNLYSQLNNHEESLDYYIKYSRMKDSLNTKEIAQREMQYEFDKIQRQHELEQIKQKAKLQRQKIVTWSFIIGFIFMLLLAFTIFRNYKQKQEANKKLAHQQKLITDSIEYAQRIQHALLPQKKMMNDLLNDFFIFYRPKNIVSGDFYWLSKKNNTIFVVAADCTGHGVPGAFMSMLGIAFLNDIVNRQNIVQADQILNELRKYVIETLHQTEGETDSKDGMDIALCTIDYDKMKLTFSGAHNPLLHFRNGSLTHLPGDRMPIGIHFAKKERLFTKKEIDIEKGDTIYMLSDGYTDQFGGKNRKKFLQKRFNEMLTDIQNIPLQEQKEIVEKRFDEWKGKYSQLDDILVMGVKI